MPPAEGFFAAAGLQLHYRRWSLPGEPRAEVAVVHGFGEHGGRYAGLAAYLASRGLAVSAMDLRGHGRSPGRRGHIGSWSEYREDLASFLRFLRGDDARRPLFLYGHSVGALVALDYAIRRPADLAGLVASAAPLVPREAAKPHQVLGARLLSRVWPHFSFRLQLDAAALARDPAVVRAYAEDPLVHDRATARWGTEAMAVTRWIRAHAARLTVPTLLLHGGADRIASPAGSRLLEAAASRADTELRVYPQSFHEPHQDLDRERVLGDVERWITAHVG